MLKGWSTAFVDNVEYLVIFIRKITRRYYIERVDRVGSSVSIVTDYGMDGQGSNPSGDEIFRLSIPTLGPTQPPVKWVPGLSRVQSAAGACC